MRILSLLGFVVVAVVTTLAWPARADDSREHEDQPVVEATIPETLHPNDFALTPADRAIVSRVRATLVANPFVPVDADAIAIEVRRGKVLLRGYVRSQALRTELSMRVPLIPGVESVDNQVAAPLTYQEPH